MNKEKLMDFLSDMIDAGADIEVSLFGSMISKTQAYDVAKRLSEITGETIEEKEANGSTWVAVGSTTKKIRGSYFFHDYLVDDLTYEEGEEIA